MFGYTLTYPANLTYPRPPDPVATRLAGHTLPAFYAAERASSKRQRLEREQQQAQLKAQRTHSNILGQTDQVVDEMKDLHKQKAAKLGNIERDFDDMLTKMKDQVDGVISKKVADAKREVN